MERPTLLFLAQVLPYPPDGGVRIRTYNVLRLLARHFDIDALCFYRRSTRSSRAEIRDSVRRLRRHAQVEAFAIPQETSRLRFVRDHVASLTTGRPYTEFVYDSGDFRSRLRELRSNRDYDLVHVDSLDLSGYLPLLTGETIVCTHHNVESELLRRRASREKGVLKGWYMRHQADLLKRTETRWCARVDLNVTVSARDRDTLMERVPGAECVVVPNGVDTEHFVPADGEVQGIVFVGGCTWFPNRDALEYFATDILPEIRQRDPRVEVRWVGRASATMQRKYAGRAEIELTGYVEDIRPYVHAAACYVVPLRVGGGSRLKILDAWAMGKAVVSTSQGCEGLEARDGENILIRDDVSSFSEAVHRVLTEPDLRDGLGAAGRATVERRYSWECIGEDLNRRYRSLLESAGWGLNEEPRDLKEVR